MVEAPIVEVEAEAGGRLAAAERPEALNALNRRLTGALEGALERVAAMDDTRVVVVAGAAARSAPATTSRKWRRSRVTRPKRSRDATRRSWRDSPRCRR